MKKTAIIIIGIAAVCLIISFFYRKVIFSNPKELTFNKWEQVHNSSSDQDKLRFAIASMVSAEDTWHSYKEFVSLVSVKVGLAEHLILRRSYKDIRLMIEQQKIDVAFVCTGTYIASLESGLLEIIATPEFEEGLKYQCYIIANKKSDIFSVSSLLNKVFAYTDPESNTGCIIPQWFFSQNGIELNSLKQTIFTGSHDRSVQAVVTGHADAAGVDALIYHSIISHTPGIGKKVRIIWESPEFGAPPMVVNRNLSMEKKRKLKEAILHFGQTPKEKAILEELQIVRFTVPDLSKYKSAIKIWKEIGKIQN